MNVEAEIQYLKKMVAELVQGQTETDRRFQEIERLLKYKLQEAKPPLTDRFKEKGHRFEETKSLLAEDSNKLDERIKQAFELFEGPWGKLVRLLEEGGLRDIFRKRGISITETYTRRKGNRNGKSFEFDIIARGTTELVIVEVKTTLRAKHVKAFLNKMDQIRELLPEYKDFQIMGGVAFLRAEESSDAMAEKRGLFVIRATGDSAALVNKPGFVPKVY